MKKYAIIAALVVLAALAFWFESQRSAAPAVARAAAETTANPPVQPAPAEPVPAPEPAAQAAPESVLPPTAAEGKVMEMYDALVVAFETHRASCRDMAIAIEDLIAAHRPALASLRDERKRLTPEEWSAAQLRLANTQGDRLERARHAMEQTVKRCSTNERLREAVRQLAAASN